MQETTIYLTPTQLIYSTLYDLSSEQNTRCYLCGGIAYQASSRKHFVKKTFTDFTYVKENQSDVVCCACAWFVSDNNEDVRRITEKPLAKPRNFSHFVIGGKWLMFTKGHKKAMADLLRSCVPQLAVIADTGQKHLVFKGHVNPQDDASGVVLFEEQPIHVQSDRFCELLNAVERLYRSGYSKVSIETGKYVFTPKSDRLLYLHTEPLIEKERGSGLLSLCIFLATLENEVLKEV